MYLYIVSKSGTIKATYGWFADGSKYSTLDNAGNGYHYIGSLIYNTSANATTTLESTDFSQGRIALSDNTQTIHYHHRDHLGSVRAITNGSGTVIEQNDYYPFGGRHTFGQNYTQTSTNRYKFNGKEEQTIGGLNLLDYGARMYDTKIARWLVQDPLAEKYYSVSAYNYCVNNPVIFVDPDGNRIKIIGEDVNTALAQLREMTQKTLSLSIDKNGFLCYSLSSDDKVDKITKTLMKIIDHEKITINLNTKLDPFTSSGKLMVGGAFMGNSLNMDDMSISANQEIMPSVLQASDNHSNTPGKMIMHEITEAFEGAKISLRKKQSSPPSNVRGTVYLKAHNKATPQTMVYQRLIDKNGYETSDIFNAIKAEWYVIYNNRAKIIQTFPNN